MTDLITRLEALLAPDRELDQDIYHALGLCKKLREGGCVDYIAPRYTASIEDANTLLEPDWDVDSGKIGNLCVANVSRLMTEAEQSKYNIPNGSLRLRARAFNEATARTIAAIKARSAT